MFEVSLPRYYFLKVHEHLSSKIICEKEDNIKVIKVFQIIA
jgi:hypothetical protein